ncbi:MAG TPA: FAD-dependent oxidoreductase [Candidatus Binatia bacterium]|jgi:glycine/D-amino acid oxidase-like deaminating enzyme/nitrite reductase/ring-hydroxylating ferredoxin subunit|nr:FAD-dependent oxidoreductase [Candidatus Binatia bacterium]
METSSPWSGGAPAGPAFPALEGVVRADVAVVGGGITGITAAYLLAKAGKKVVLVEKDKLLSGETGFTTAFLTYVPDVRLTKMRAAFGDDAAKRVCLAGAEAIDAIERIAREEGIECGFRRCDATIYATDAAGLRVLAEERDVAVGWGLPMALHEGAFAVPAAGRLVVPGQAKFDPRKFLLGLAEKAVARGAVIHEDAPVTGFEGKGTVVTRGGRIEADEVIVATHSPIDDPMEIPTRLLTFQTYVIEALLPKGVLPEGIYWDTAVPYHFFRVDAGADRDRVLFGGEDREAGTETDAAPHHEALKGELARLLPGVAVEHVRAWGGQIMHSCDGLPYVGRSKKNMRHLVASGYGGNGMTFGTIAAGVMTDLVLGRENAMAAILSPSRRDPLGPTVGRFIKMLEKYFGGFLRGALPSEVAAIPAGSGDVIRLRGRRVAVHRTKEGKVMAVSPVCTHLGCTVRWNQARTSWDCPCHGSRFDVDGKVLNGPATEPLASVPIDGAKK